MNGIQVTKADRQQCNLLLDAVVTIIEYNKSTIDHAIYIKVFSDETVSCITVSTDGFLNTINSETAFPELRRVFEEAFKIKFQEGYVFKYLHFRIFHYPIGLSVDKNYHIMVMLNG